MSAPSARPPRALALAAALALACSTGDDGTASSETGATGLATTEATSTSTTDDATTTTTGTTEVTSTSTSTSTTTTTTTTGETTGASATTTTAGCPEGTEGCPCDGGACEGELSCVAGTCVAPLDCPGGADEEPNNSEAEAQDLGMITDDDDDGSTIAGTLAGKGDVDWFTYIGSDTVLHTTEPTRQVDAAMGLRFCKFIECLDGGPAVTEINCPAGSDFAISPQLRPGCCSGEGFELADYNCPGTDDSLRVYFRLDRALFDECIDYSVSYFL